MFDGRAIRESLKPARRRRQVGGYPPVQQTFQMLH